MNEIFAQLTEKVGECPEAVVLFLCPALLLVAGLLLAILHAKRGYLPAAVGLGGAQLFLSACTSDLNECAAFMGLYVLFAALVRLLFLIPFPKKRESDAEELYRKFRLPLEEPAPAPAPEETGEDDLRLGHAFALAEQLSGCDLTPSDRLEADALSRTLDAYRGRKLNEEEKRAVNDCLATLLKLTAKYKL